MKLKNISIILGVSSLLAVNAVEASHFRGGTLIPTITSGVLTVESTSFWRPTSVDSTFVTSTQGSMTQTATSTDTSDSRFTRVTQTFTQTLTLGAGAIDVDWDSCCRVTGSVNTGSSSMALHSSIVWDGTNDTAPILFDLLSIQPEVLRGGAYSDNLGAVSGDGLSLSYNGVLPIGISGQAPGLVIDPTTGQLTISAANTPAYVDNTGGNDGADAAFGGQIIASNGSVVGYDWMFDGVDGLSNTAPNVTDAVINALVGDTVTHTATGSDPEGDSLAWSLLSFNGPGASLLDVLFDPNTQLFTFDSTGFDPGTYIANIRASDGFLTDVGSITINLRPAIPAHNVPEPSSLALMSLAAFGFGFSRRKVKK